MIQMTVMVDDAGPVIKKNSQPMLLVSRIDVLTIYPSYAGDNSSHYATCVLGCIQ